MEGHICDNQSGDKRQTYDSGTCVHKASDAHAVEVVNSIVSYLREHPVNYYGQVDTLLELIYQAYTEFCLVETDDEADSYMSLVFELCTEYERQSYIEWMKTGARLVVELMGGDVRL